MFGVPAPETRIPARGPNRHSDCSRDSCVRSIGGMPCACLTPSDAVWLAQCTARCFNLFCAWRKVTASTELTWDCRPWANITQRGGENRGGCGENLKFSGEKLKFAGEKKSIHRLSDTCYRHCCEQRLTQEVLRLRLLLRVCHASAALLACSGGQTGELCLVHKYVSFTKTTCVSFTSISTSADIAGVRRSFLPTCWTPRTTMTRTWRVYASRHLECWVMLCNMLYNRGGVISHIPVI